MPKRSLLAGLLSLALIPLVALGTATPAVAAGCATAGHTYVISSGTFYSSGYEGNYQNGIQYIVLPEGTPFQVGGNGIKPDTYLDVHLFRTDLVPPDWSLIAQQNAFRQPAGGNCVVNQKWVTPNVSPTTGTYQVRAFYRSGNSDQNVEETVLFIIFIPRTPGGGGGGGGGCIRACPL